MAFQVSFERAADRALDSLPKRDCARVLSKIESLERDPRPTGAKKLVGETDVWRIRVGDYRVIYRVKDAELVILIIKIGHRREVYRGR